MICVFIIGREHPKAHRKWFYVVLWFYGEAGNRTCDPWFTRHSAYPLHHGGFSSILMYYLHIVCIFEMKFSLNKA